MLKGNIPEFSKSQQDFIQSLVDKQVTTHINGKCNFDNLVVAVIQKS